MLPQSTSSKAPPIDPTQRKWFVGIIVATVVILAMVIADLAIGGRPDPSVLRSAATLLDGSWKFHIGDDPRWAAPDLDDNGWEAVDLTPSPGSHDGDVGLPDYMSGWMAHGHPGYQGYAWYRRVVTVPSSHAYWDILGPTIVEDGYELYWNGRLLGGSGRLGPKPRVVGTRPTLFELHADAAGTRGVLAIRSYMMPGFGRSAKAGGLHTPPILAPRPTASALHRVQWQRTIAGYIADAVEPLAMLALIALALGHLSRSSQKGFLVFACIALLLTAIRRASNAIISWTDLEDLTIYAWMAALMWIPTVAAWVMAWNRWGARSWRSVDVLAVVLAIAAVIGVFTHSANLTHVSRLGAIALFIVTSVRIARTGPMRALALVTVASILAVMFGGELLDPLDVPGIWFPFGIGVARTQYIYMIAVPLMAFLMVRTVRFDSNAASNEDGVVSA